MQPSDSFSLHEVEHATFEFFNVPIFGHEEDAADNFVTYVMLQFGRGQARRLIGGAAWAWRVVFRGLQEEPRDADADSRLCE